MKPRKISLPNEKLLETREIWLSDKVEFIERRVVRSDLEFVAVINDFRIVLPITDYPYYLSVPDLQDYPKNHFEIGLFGWMGYWINKDRQMIDSCALPGQRLAHLHYFYQKRPVFVDVGQYQYDKLLKQLKTKAIPKDCRPDHLFELMEPQLKDFGERYLRI